MTIIIAFQIANSTKISMALSDFERMKRQLNAVNSSGKYYLELIEGPVCQLRGIIDKKKPKKFKSNQIWVNIVLGDDFEPVKTNFFFAVKKTKKVLKKQSTSPSSEKVKKWKKHHKTTYVESCIPGYFPIIIELIDLMRYIKNLLERMYPIFVINTVSITLLLMIILLFHNMFSQKKRKFSGTSPSIMEETCSLLDAFHLTFPR